MMVLLHVCLKQFQAKLAEKKAAQASRMEPPSKTSAPSANPDEIDTLPFEWPLAPAQVISLNLDEPARRQDDKLLTAKTLVLGDLEEEEQSKPEPFSESLGPKLDDVYPLPQEQASLEQESKDEDPEIKEAEIKNGVATASSGKVSNVEAAPSGKVNKEVFNALEYQDC